MLKEQVKEQNEVQALRQCKWRNIVFDINGKSYRGMTLFDSRAKAAGQLEQYKSQRTPDTATTRYYKNTLDGRFYNRDYAWAMQMPVMEAE